LRYKQPNSTDTAARFFGGVVKNNTLALIIDTKYFIFAQKNLKVINAEKTKRKTIFQAKSAAERTPA
jgi:hypothetical protein